MISIWNLEQAPQHKFFNIFPPNFLLLAEYNTFNFISDIRHMKMSILNLERIFVPKFFHGQRSAITQPSLARDGLHKTAMAVDGPL